MKFKLSILIFLSVLLKNVNGQELNQAPLNDEFVNFISSKTKVKGDIPAPTTYVFSDEINSEIAKYSFPESYDLRDESLVSSVKNQGGAGHCWSFAAIGAIESRELKLGFDEYNLSEHNMATCHGFEWEQGGNQSIATAYLSRLSGPILETEDPYNDYEFSCSATEKTPQFYVPESRFLPRNADVIKYYLMNYGAIAVSYYHADVYFSNTNDTYYYNGTEGSNHGVLLVGWDDTKTTAGGTGAWIIKNSWGTSWGENGFFYMSYKDSHAIDKATIYPIRKDTNNIDTILMYDTFGEISSYGFGDSEDYALIKFEVNEEYHFNKIGTFIGASNSIVDIEVFDTKTSNILSDTIATAYNLFVEHPGYYTFDLPFSVSGDFYIKIKYFSPNDKYPIPVEMKVADYAYPEIKSNVGWISNKGDVWTSVGTGTDAEIDLCIRAYGTNSNVKASFTSDYTTICYDSDVIFTSTSNGDIVSYLWDFGQDATPATASTEGPHMVNYSSEGFKTIKLKIENSTGIKDSIVNYNFVNVNSEIHINIAPGDSFYLTAGDTIELNAFGANSFEWYPQALVIGGDFTASTIRVSPENDTTIYVNGTMNGCVSTDSVRIIIFEAPENDNVCNAITLTLNEEAGPFSNAHASVQENEPFPTLGGCSTAMEWCDEGGLQNSVWFKFTAPKSGAINIETDGFDNQIALYEAESCEDLISGNDALYELIAANDDWEDDDYSATIDDLSGLKSGKVYWLQMDGSAGGDEGECTILITSLEHENDSPCDAKELDFFTNYSENNTYASVDNNEAFPDNSDCTSQVSWCPDDTLNATVWYKFSGPASGIVSIESSGFDNQIAVYSTSNCENLLSGNPADYTILAANDNYESSNAASIYAITELTENETYYIQVDGKNDNFFGDFTLYLKEWPLAIEEAFDKNTQIKAYPNPSNGEFKLDLSKIRDMNQSTNIEVLSMDGSVIQTITCSENKYEYELKVDHAGIFIVKVNTQNDQYSIPILIK